MFFAAVEIRDNPQLKGKPVAVGSFSMLSTSNYVARKYGVRSAMPGFIAKKLCPELIIVESNRDKYHQSSKQFKAILYKYDNEMESMGLDEANLDITNYLQQHNIDIKNQTAIENLCKGIRIQVHKKLGVTCSCGISCNKMMAKICSEVNKPNNQFYLPPCKEKILDFMRKQKVRRIPGIGPKSESMLRFFGIETCGQMLDNLLIIKFGFTERSFDFFVEASLGISRCYHTEAEDRKSIGRSETIQTTKNEQILKKLIYDLSEQVHEDMESEGFLGKTVTLTIKTHKFQQTQHSQTLPSYINDHMQIYQICLGLFQKRLNKDPIRLLGVTMRNLMLEKDFQSNNLQNYFKKSVDNKKQGQQKKIGEEDMQILSIIPEVEHQSKQQAQSEDLFQQNTNNNQSGIRPNSTPVQQFHQKNSINSNNNSFAQNINVKSAQAFSGKSSKENSEALSSFKKQFIPKEFTCPICLKVIETNFNVASINRHMDICLENAQKQLDISTLEEKENSQYNSMNNTSMMSAINNESFIEKNPLKRKRPKTKNQESSDEVVIPKKYRQQKQKQKRKYNKRARKSKSNSKSASKEGSKEKTLENFFLKKTDL